MARNLRKFVNPKFLDSVALSLLRQLFDRQPGGSWDHTVLFEGENDAARARVKALLQGPERDLPQGLVADLHNISELGTNHGMILLQQRAERLGVVIGTGDADPPHVLDPKHFALLAFLKYPQIFEAASDLMSFEARTSLAEYVGTEENVEPLLDEETKAAFSAAAGRVFQRDERSDYCRVGWYEDDDELNIVVTHGAPVTLRPVIEGEKENVISYRATEHAVLSYHAPSGRLKVGGVPQARRAALAAIFADTMLRRQDFFAGPDSQQLYSLTPVEKRGYAFQIDHAFDPSIARAEVTEVQLERVMTDTRTGEVRVLSSLLVKDTRRNALLALQDVVPHGVNYGPNRYRIGHLGFRLQFAVPGERPGRATVKVKPPSQAVFKRHRFEGRIMELLRRNGFCYDRHATETTAAPE